MATQIRLGEVGWPLGQCLELGTATAGASKRKGEINGRQITHLHCSARSNNLLPAYVHADVALRDHKAHKAFMVPILPLVIYYSGNEVARGRTMSHKPRRYT